MIAKKPILNYKNLSFNLPGYSMCKSVSSYIALKKSLSPSGP